MGQASLESDALKSTAGNWLPGGLLVHDELIFLPQTRYVLMLCWNSFRLAERWVCCTLVAASYSTSVRQLLTIVVSDQRVSGVFSAGHTLTHLFTDSFTYSLTHTHLHNNLLTQFIHSLIHTLTHSHSLKHSLTHSLIDSFIHSHTHSWFAVFRPQPLLCLIFYTTISWHPSKIKDSLN